MIGATTLALASGGFTLDWTHSVEHVGWREHWRVVGDQLTLTRAAVRGSGAGMEPGDDARLVDGWWVWSPGTVVPELRLAASGATGAGWRLCADGRCHEIGAAASEPLRLAPCPAVAAPSG